MLNFLFEWSWHKVLVGEPAGEVIYILSFLKNFNFFMKIIKFKCSSFIY